MTDLERKIMLEKIMRAFIRKQSVTLTAAEVQWLMTQNPGEWIHGQWADFDSPLADMTFGVKKEDAPKAIPDWRIGLWVKQKPGMPNVRSDGAKCPASFGNIIRVMKDFEGKEHLVLSLGDGTEVVVPADNWMTA